jgi:hypothetical protein
VEKPYHIVGRASREELGRYLAKNGQVLLPRVELIEQSKLAIDALIDVLGRGRSRRCCGCRQKGSRARRIRGRRVAKSVGTGGRKARSV